MLMWRCIVTSATDKREFTRAPVAVEAQIRAGDKAAVCNHTADVSMKGVFLVGLADLPVGTRCRLTMFLGGRDNGERIDVTGRVARVDTQGAGIVFSEIMGLESLTHLRRLVLLNARDTDRVEREFESHSGLKKIG